MTSKEDKPGFSDADQRPFVRRTEAVEVTDLLGETRIIEPASPETCKILEEIVKEHHDALQRLADR